MTRLLVLSDLHSNAFAVSAALKEVHRLSPDAVVVLGDLLTYGPAVNEVLDVMLELAATTPTRFVRGNHDELYLDLAVGKIDYLRTLPQWLQDVVQWTAASLDLSRLRAVPFENEVEFGRVLLSHANPWGDWRYLNSLDEHRQAAATLTEREFTCGLFGHTHRPQLYSVRDDELRGPWERCQVDLDGSGDTIVANVGSVGQPRCVDKRACLAVVDLDASSMAMSLRRVEYPIERHLASLDRLPLDVAIRRRLRRFFDDEGETTRTP